jgi:hypothetical protein
MVFPPKRSAKVRVVKKRGRRGLLPEVLLLLLGCVWTLEVTARIDPPAPFCVVDGYTSRCDDLCSPELEAQGKHVRSLLFTGPRLDEGCSSFLPNLKVSFSSQVFQLGGT